MDTRCDSDPAMERPPADRGGRGLRAVEPAEPLQVGDGLLQVDDGLLQVDAGLLRDAAAVLTARRELDALLVQLAVVPFSAAAYDALRAYLAGSGRRAQAAYSRLCASTGTADR
jgi:hypothetical protein